MGKAMQPPNHEMSAIVNSNGDAARSSLSPAVRIVLDVALLLGMCGAFAGLVAWQDPSLRHYDSPALREAQSLLNGSVALSERVHDTALYQGQVRNVFQPGQTLLFLAHCAVGKTCRLAHYQLEILLVVLLTAPLVISALRKLCGGKWFFSASLAVSFLCGAPYLANLPLSYVGSLYRVNHCLALLFAAGALKLLSRELTPKRLFLVGLCVGGAMLFRTQYVLMLSLPALLLLQDRAGNAWHLRHILGDAAARRRLIGQLEHLAKVPILAMVLILAFQAVRFGDPFENGYRYLYEGRDDYVAARAQMHGLVSLHYLPENLYRTLWASPTLQFDGWSVVSLEVDDRGNSLIFSQPILLLLLLLAPSLRRPRAQAFLVTALLLSLPVWLYHNPGYLAPGYMRLSLDYLIFWFAVLAVCAESKRVNVFVNLAALLLAASAAGYGLLLIHPPM